MRILKPKLLAAIITSLLGLTLTVQANDPYKPYPGSPPAQHSQTPSYALAPPAPDSRPYAGYYPSTATAWHGGPQTIPNPALDPHWLRAELAASHAQWQSATERLAVSQLLLQQAQESLSFYFRELQQLRSALADQTAQISANSANMATTQSHIAKLSEELQAARTALTQQQALLAKYTAKENEPAQKRTGIEHVHAENMLTDAEGDSSESQYQSCQQQIRTLQSELDTTQGSQVALQQSLKESQLNRDQLRTRLETATTELQTRQDALARATTSESAVTAQRDALQVQLANVIASANQKENARQSDSDTQLAALSKQLQQTETTLNSEIAAKAAMQKALTDTISKRDRLLADLDTVNQRNSTEAQQEQSAIVEVQHQLLACNTQLTAVKAVISASAQPVSVVQNVSMASNSTRKPSAELAALESNSRPDLNSVDTDADGVVDTKDLCPESPAGAEVDGLGCTANIPIALGGVKFRYDSDTITHSSKAILNHIAGVLRESPELRIEIAGHSDTQGDATYNLWLSEQRAKSVMSYLVMQGVSQDRLTAQGYGGLQPIAENTTREGLALNRRVELRKLP